MLLAQRYLLKNQDIQTICSYNRKTFDFFHNVTKIHAYKQVGNLCTKSWCLIFIFENTMVQVVVLYVTMVHSSKVNTLTENTVGLFIDLPDWQTILKSIYYKVDQIVHFNKKNILNTAFKKNIIKLFFPIFELNQNGS